MFGSRLKLFRLLGFEVRIDASWLIIALLITWSLAYETFPLNYPGLPAWTYWVMGIGGALGLFSSVVFHELCHSLVARRYGLQMRGITLFIFGGVAEMESEPPTARAEFWIAIAGPISSAVLAGIFYLIALGAGAPAGWRYAIDGVVAFLFTINLSLAIFNLLPAFPLDGGRVLRSVLWGWKRSLPWATRISASIGSGFGLLLIAFGIVQLLFLHNIIGGIWLALIGMFLRNAARMSYRQLLLGTVLQGVKVRSFMSADPVTVPPGITVQDLVEGFIYRHHADVFPVVDDGVLVGCITVDQVKDVPREEWARRTVRDIAPTCSAESTIGPDEDAMQALLRMNRTGRSALLVVEGGRLDGVITAKDLYRFLTLKVDLEGRGRILPPAHGSGHAREFGLPPNPAPGAPPVPDRHDGDASTRPH
jgi:Zn-dependent protease/CBS domain-containing protein